MPKDRDSVKFIATHSSRAEQASEDNNDTGHHSTYIHISAHYTDLAVRILCSGLKWMALVGPRSTFCMHSPVPLYRLPF